MQNKIYASFHQINEELHLLKLEKDINYHTLALSFQKIKVNIQPNYIKREVILAIKEKLSEKYRSLLVFIIPYILNFIKRKRGQ